MTLSLEDQTKKIIMANMRMAHDMVASNKYTLDETTDVFLNALPFCIGMLTAAAPEQKRKELCHTLTKVLVEQIMEHGRDYDTWGKT